MPTSLSGLRVLVTRPTAQAQEILKALHQHSVKAWHFPLIDIIPLKTPLATKLRNKISQYNLTIFISPNAVYYLAKALGEPHNLPENLKLACIGQGSAQELIKIFGRSADILPAESGKQDSEALLENPQLAEIYTQNQRILIVRGLGGREHLATVLRQRKAKVDYLEVYQRIKPASEPAKLNQSIAEHQLDVILLTSAEALDNLLVLVKAQYKTSLFHIPLVVIHHRQLIKAEDCGFLHVYLSRGADPNSVIETLKSIN